MNRKPKLFLEALYHLCEPDMFNVTLTEQEEDNVFETTIRLSQEQKLIPTNFLEWRDLVYDAMEIVGYKIV